MKREMIPVKRTKVGEIGEGYGCKRLKLSDAALTSTKDIVAVPVTSPASGKNSTSKSILRGLA